MEKDHLNIINKAKGNRLLNKTISKRGAMQVAYVYMKSINFLKFTGSNCKYAKILSMSHTVQLKLIRK